MWTDGQRIGGSGGQRPPAVATDTDRSDPVSRGIRSTQHMRGGGAAHVVFGRLAAEQHDEVDALVGTHVVPDGTVSGHAIPSELGG